ncbi:MAG: Lipid II flippase MurJ [Phycisphaerae bacterium]|nr:Lipid II flippase MurJ [Phycisphaerae bacterium]
MDAPQQTASRHGRFISAARVFAGLTLVSRLLGLVRDKVCALIFGNGEIWSAYTIAFMIPNLFRRLFGEGALSSALVPVLTDYETGDAPEVREAGRRLVSAVVTLLTMLLAAITLGVEAILLTAWTAGGLSPHNVLVVTLTAVMLPYMILICLVAVGSAVLNVRGRFAEGAAAPIVLNVCIIVAAAWMAPRLADSPSRQIFTVAWAVLVAGVLQLLLIWRAMRVRGIRLSFLADWHHPGVRKVALLMAPMVAGLAVVQLNTLADRLIAWILTERVGHTAWHVLGVTIPRMLDEGAVATLERATRLYEFPLGLFAVAVATAIFPAFSRHAAENDLPGLADTLRRGIEIKLLVAIPATVGLVMIRRELTQLIFEGGRFRAADTRRVAWVMSFYVLGLAAFSVQQLLTRAFYALKRVRLPVRVAAWMVALNLPLNLVLVLSMRDEAGLALSTTICAFIQAVWLAVALRRLLGRMGGRRMLDATLRICAASAVMASAVWLVRDWAVGYWGSGLGGWDARSGRVLIPVVVGGAVFYLAARALRIQALRELLSREA